jgi:acyl carrier protein
MSATEEIHSRVARVLVEVLNADEDDVTPGATLQGDLGAESIDFMDIIFRLEREFDIRIQGDELFPEAIFRDEPGFVQDGRLTDQGLAELRSRLPHADLSELESDRRLSNIPDLFTVGLVSRYVAWKLSRGAEAGRGDPTSGEVTASSSAGSQD